MLTSRHHSLLRAGRVSAVTVTPASGAAQRPASGPRRLRPAAAPAAGLALALLLAACGSGDSADDESASPSAESAPATDAATDAAGEFPVEVLSGALDGGTEVTIEAKPEAIISLSPSATETLFAIGAGDQVIAVDDQSDYPAEAPMTDLSGFQPNLEAILGYEPDLVVLSRDDELVAGLEAAGVPALSMPAATDIDEAYSQFERLGAATGQVAGAAALVAETQERIDAALADLPALDPAPTYYHELDSTFFTVTSGTFIGDVYALAGLENIADATGGEDLYPQLNEEFIVEADPDVIYLAGGADRPDVTAEAVAARPGWEQLTAVEGGQVIVVDENIASRWGPRVADFVEEVAVSVAALEPATAG